MDYNSSSAVTRHSPLVSHPQLDEVVAESWDSDKRIIRAGACELVIRRHLLLHDLKKLQDKFKQADGAKTPKRRRLSGMPETSVDDDKNDDSDQPRIKRTGSNSKLLASSSLGTMGAQSKVISQTHDKRKKLIHDIVVFEMQKKKVSFGILTHLFMSLNDALEGSCGRIFPENCMFERFAPYLTTVDWNAVLECGPPDRKEVGQFRCRPLAGGDSVELLERETLPYIPPKNVIEKEIIGRLFLYGSLQKIAKNVSEADASTVAKFNHVLNGVFDVVLFWSMALVQLLFPFGIAAFIVFGPYCYANLPQ